MARKTIIVAFALALAAGAAWAGTGGDLICGNKDCGYRERVGFGGGRMFEEMTGYCIHCQKFVSQRWARQPGRVPAGVDLPREKPKPIGTVWIPATGQKIELYPCPACKGPFVPTTADEIKHCPKCGGDDIKFNRTIMYD